jgi:hypothetical protein
MTQRTRANLQSEPWTGTGVRKFTRQVPDSLCWTFKKDIMDVLQGWLRRGSHLGLRKLSSNQTAFLFQIPRLCIWNSGQSTQEFASQWLSFSWCGNEKTFATKGNWFGLNNLAKQAFIDVQGNQDKNEWNNPNSSKKFLNSSERPPLQIALGENRLSLLRDHGHLLSGSVSNGKTAT